MNSKKYGMFQAVFTPSILTILGVIMYQRLGWVVGHAGLGMAILIILLAHVISITTGLSIASIATNRTTGAGGNYYIISRSLGLSIGGAIGIAFYFSLAISIALYLIGFAESFNDILGLGSDIWNVRITALVALVVLTIITYISTSFALKTQYVILVAIVLSIISLFMGTPTTQVSAEAVPVQDPGHSFEFLFAIFFPAVTGFTAGVNMSGDLKDPRKSIPLGTILAIVAGMIVYVSLAIFFATKIGVNELINDRMLWANIARWPELVAAGVWGATASSALGCILGGPRTLQALAKDGVVPRIFEKGRGEMNEPTYSLFFTVAIAAVAIVVGDLNFLARILSMAFLTVYGTISLSYALEKWTNNPAFRPTFKVSHLYGFIGAVVAFLLMFKLDTLAMVAALIIMFIIFAMLRKRRLKSSSGDAWGGVWSALVRTGLLKLKVSDSNGRNWRPNMVIMGGIPTERGYMIDFAEWIVQDSGIITYFFLIQGKIRDNLGERKQLVGRMKDYMSDNHPEMFTRVDVCDDLYKGITTVAQSYGLAEMESNTVLLGWPKNSENQKGFLEMFLDMVHLEKNILFLDYDPVKGYGNHSTIDVWWGGLDKNGSLMLILAGLISASDKWNKSKVRVLMIVDKKYKEERVSKKLEKILDKSHINAEQKIICTEGLKDSIPSVIQDVSENTDLVIMGMRHPKNESVDLFTEVSGRTRALGSVLHVSASKALDAEEILFVGDEVALSENE